MASSKYKQLEPREHILTRPTIYIGSLEPTDAVTWVASQGDPTRFERRSVRYVPALYKIIDEVFVNAVDHVQRLSQEAKDDGDVVPVRRIDITLDADTGVVAVQNDGDGIDVVVHDDVGVFVPEMIFGRVLTSSNYSDEQERLVGGQNGIGAKACNIFSTFFRVETVDRRRKLLYEQEFTANMSQRTEPKIKKFAKRPFTKVTFRPDFARFGIAGFDADMLLLVKRRCYDLCALTPKTVAVTFNGEKLEVKDFERYVDMYVGRDAPRVGIELGNGWSLVVAESPDGTFEHVSFVNGVWTMRGGKHVDGVANALSARLADAISRKKKLPSAVRPQLVRSHLMLFLMSTVPNPTFDTQSKEMLLSLKGRLDAEQLGMDERFVERVQTKLSLASKVMDATEAADRKNLKRTDGKKVSRLSGIVKLDDANLAGTAKSHECTLILTEGDSAKTMALAGLSVVGRDRFGVFPLRGKPMNVRDVPLQKIAENEEIASIKRILGLESGKTYADTSGLRYGRVMIMTDADADGSHIKGLLFNLFHALWPTLACKRGFLTSMLTPVIKIRRRGGTETREFYDVAGYKRWRDGVDAAERARWDVKYYKGLGTSTDAEARQYFRDLHVVTYDWTDADASADALDLAFNKRRADDRKAWLTHDARPMTDAADGGRTVPVDLFVNGELIEFSRYDVERSIPSVVDGLKVSQRKIMHACFKRRLDSEIKVAQLAGYVAEHAAYHHGEASLMATIIGLAQTYVGSNNVNLLRPIGQFGSRIHGGKDASQPRYINTMLEPIAHKLFRAEDLPILDYLDDDGFQVEPRHFVPIVPLVLINGAVGIGTGFSTNVPCFDPSQVIRAVRERVRGAGGPGETPAKPWYRGFLGEIEVLEDGRVQSRGRYERVSGTQLRVTELPLGTWTEAWKEVLEAAIASGVLRGYASNYTNKRVDFALTFPDEATLDRALQDPRQLERDFKLTSNKMLGTANMWLFDERGQIIKYDSFDAIVDAFVPVRARAYERRKTHQLQELERELQLAEAKVRFVDEVLGRDLRIADMDRKELADELQRRAYPAAQDGFEYLCRMPMTSMNTDRQRELRDRVVALRDALARLRDTTVEETWLRELGELELALAHLVADEVEDEDVVPASKGSRKRGSSAAKTVAKKPRSKAV